MNDAFNLCYHHQNSQSRSVYMAHRNLLSRFFVKIFSILTSFFLHQTTEIRGSL